MKPLKKILLVDDDAVTNLLNEYILKNSGISEGVLVCTSGNKALELLDSPSVADDIDLIFLDINMPGISGFEFIEKYKKARLKRYAPIVLLTTSISDRDMAMAKKYEIMGYFDKPLDSRKLNTFFKKFLAKRSANKIGT